MRIQKLGLLGLGLACLLLAQQTPSPKPESSKTENLEFPAGGLLRIENFSGELTIEGWDRPDVQFTTVRTESDEPNVSAERRDRDSEVVIRTPYPHRSGLSKVVPHRAEAGIQYRIEVPRAARLAIDHGSGDVSIVGVTGAISANVSRGEVLLRLPPDGKYDIDARSRLGGVVSDFPGRERKNRWRLGRAFVAGDSTAAQKFSLRIGYGDIIILKAAEPVESAPAAQ